MWCSSHPKKYIEAALRYAENQGWRVETGGSPAWGKMHCPCNDDGCRCGEFCLACIWSTPKNPGNHALARQNMHKLMHKHHHSFPAPVHEGSATIWHLADVLSWLHARGNYQLERSLIELAQATRQINHAREAAQAAPIPADIAAMLGA